MPTANASSNSSRAQAAWARSGTSCRRSSRAHCARARCSSSGTCCITDRSMSVYGVKPDSSIFSPRPRELPPGRSRFIPTANGQARVQQEFLKAMMLGASSTGGLTPLRRGDRRAHGRAFRSHVHASGQADTRLQRLLRPVVRAPARVMKGLEPNEMTRFFGAGKGAAGARAPDRGDQGYGRRAVARQSRRHVR